MMKMEQENSAYNGSAPTSKLLKSYRIFHTRKLFESAEGQKYSHRPTYAWIITDRRPTIQGNKGEQRRDLNPTKGDEFIEKIAPIDVFVKMTALSLQVPHRGGCRKIRKGKTVKRTILIGTTPICRCKIEVTKDNTGKFGSAPGRF